ncbi:unnamed protein product [Symbiodinium sp. CCMP2456]|nr:unnamed protein product [Symbiodinium sp. CCMP2456]
MKQPSLSRRCAWATVWCWVMLPLATSMKLLEESNASTFGAVATKSKHHFNESVADVQQALILRSSQGSHQERANTSRDQALDAVVSAKFFHDIGDAFADIGETLADAGMTAGTAMFNAAVVVGKHVVATAKISYDTLPQDIKQMAEDLGDAAVSLGHTVADVGQQIGQAAVTLAGDLKDTAARAYDKAKNLANDIQSEMQAGLTALGDSIANAAEKFGAMVAAVGTAAWEGIKDFVECLANAYNPCNLLIGDQCDCNDSSYISFGTTVSVACKFKAAADFGKGFSFQPDPLKTTFGQAENGKVSLPGRDSEVTDLPKTKRLSKPTKSLAPTGSCESSLELAIEGGVQFLPLVEASINLGSGDTTFTIHGLIRASVGALAKAQGSCSFNAEKRFPEKPKKKAICGPGFCIIILLQMVAELEITGTLTGTVEVGAGVDFEVEGTVIVNPTGTASVNFQSPSISHQNGFSIGASASASIRLGAGPVLTVFPMPGVPVTFNPMFHAEAKAQGTIKFQSTNTVGSLIDNSHPAGQLDMCGAAALNVYADVGIIGFALPPEFRKLFRPAQLVDMMKQGMIDNAKAMFRMITGAANCAGLGAVTSAVEDKFVAVAEAGAAALSGPLNRLPLDWALKAIDLMQPRKLFCKTVFTTPGFSTAPCAADLGCEKSGRSKEPGNAAPPPEQVENTNVLEHAAAGACSDIKFGDRFIQLGDWRLAEIDDEHFSISYKDGSTQGQIWKKDGSVHGNFGGATFNAWGPTRPVLAQAKGISFGFQFIQIGNWRIGAADNDHLSITHKDGWSPMIYKFDGSRHPKMQGAFSTWDRSVGAPYGVSWGHKFLQFGKFRIGDLDGTHFAIIYTDDAKNSRDAKLIQLYRNDGTQHPGAWWKTDPMNSVAPSAWTCPSVAEIAFGPCDADFGAWGDRFIQLGKFRITATDANHLSISHKDKKTAVIYSGNPTSHGVHYGPRDDFGGWDRPTGFPHGISFGTGFIQIGNFRLAAKDETHLSISHQTAGCIRIFDSAGNLFDGRGRDDHNAFLLRSTGAPAGVTFGEKFLQLGQFRLGDRDGSNFMITHLTANGGTGIELFNSWGQRYVIKEWPSLQSWFSVLNSRPAQYHCGSVQDVLGTCPGVLAGDGFLQLGSWRLGANQDAGHLVITHEHGQTAVIYVENDGATGAHYVHLGPRQDFWNAWVGEPKAPTQDHEVKFGDRFIQMGKFRIGEVRTDRDHLVISTPKGVTTDIFRSDGHRFQGPHRDPTWNLWSDSRPAGAPVGVTFGDGFAQIGNFRIGDAGEGHFSVAHVSGWTSALFTPDGNQHWGASNDWTTFGRPLHECTVVGQP